MLPGAQPSVVVANFSGPFDLLVRLIERRELDVLTISLAEVTEQYLDHLAVVQQRDPEHLSAFLVVAAKLLLIKSSLLLPSPPRAAAIEDVAVDPDDLAARLRTYQTFRQAAQWLGARNDAGLRSFPRPLVADQPSAPPPPEQLDPGLLAQALRQALQRERRHQELEPEVLAEARYSVADALAALQSALGRYLSIQFGDLVAAAPTRQRYVATFLAVLELVRLGLADVAQSDRFGPIVVSGRPQTESEKGAASA